MKRFVLLIKDLAVEPLVLFLYLIVYFFTGEMRARGRQALLRLHCATNARFSEFLAKAFSVIYKKPNFENSDGFFGQLNRDRCAGISSVLHRDGYYVFDTKLPPDVCDSLEKLARKTPCVAGYSGSGVDQGLFLYDENDPKFETYRLRESDLVCFDIVQNVISDKGFLSIANEYLNGRSILSTVAMWWSTNFQRTASADAGQLFHFDFDPPPKWLIFFIYLTDVDAEHGPHVFVKKTHQSGLKSCRDFLRRGYVRISDHEIDQAFGDDVVKIMAPRGTIIAVDTRGFHKGSYVEKNRLMMQLTYSFPVFSGAHGYINREFKVVSEALRSVIKFDKYSFSRYFK